MIDSDIPLLLSKKAMKAMKMKIEENIACACSSNSVFEKGDIGWYSRIGRWLGSGKVVYQDGKFICVRHGSVLIRVAANKIVRKEDHFEEEKKRTHVLPRS